jgi:hypothetical protein
VSAKPIELTDSQVKVLRSVAKRANIPLDSQAVGVLYGLGFVAIQAPGEPSISITPPGTKWLELNSESGDE